MSETVQDVQLKLIVITNRSMSPAT